MQNQEEEHLDVLTKSGHKTGISKPRGDVHRDGDYHRAVHVWIFAESTQQLLLQRRAHCKDSWPDLWDISSAGHISAGDSSLITAQRELEEELGVTLPKDAFELIFVFLQECVINDGKYINNEYNDVYLVTTLDPIPLEALTLQELQRANSHERSGKTRIVLESTIFFGLSYDRRVSRVSRSWIPVATQTWFELSDLVLLHSKIEPLFPLSATPLTASFFFLSHMCHC